MKFDKNRGSEKNGQSDDKDAIRKKIWETPSLIKQLFNDHDWQQFEGNGEQPVAPSQEMLKHIHTEMERQELERELKAQRKQRTLKIIRYSSAAAASILLIISLSLWQVKTPTVDNQLTELNLAEPNSSITDTVWTILENTSQKIKTVKLPDQSTISLFANSSVRFPKNFSKETRDISLNGKVYFSVAKDPSRPFSVYAGGTKTTALGTSFTIDTRSKLSTTAVKLHTGKVVVASTNSRQIFKKVFLSRQGESFLFDANLNRAEFVKLGRKPATKTRRIKNVLLSDIANIPLPDVILALQEAYKVKINIGNTSLANIQYTGSIDVESETIHDALTLICLINDLRYVIEKDGSYTIYTISPNKQK